MTYRADGQDRLVWVPTGWRCTPPHVLGPPETAAERSARAQEHARRVRNRRFTQPGDWPAFLLAFHPGRPLPWRLAKLTCTPRKVTWYATKEQALDEGYRV
jgi:hypothetical protein